MRNSYDKLLNSMNKILYLIPQFICITGKAFTNYIMYSRVLHVF